LRRSVGTTARRLAHRGMSKQDPAARVKHARAAHFRHRIQNARPAQSDRDRAPDHLRLHAVAADPHALLREVHRTVRPEGQVVIAGFNPFSLFGARRYFGRGVTPPWNGSFIALYRLKDWLALLGFDVTGGSLDCYVPPFTQEKWLRRFAFFERTGDRWWPIAGGVYFLRATKKIIGMRVITPAWERRKNGLATAPRQALNR